MVGRGRDATMPAWMQQQQEPAAPGAPGADMEIDEQEVHARLMQEQEQQVQAMLRCVGFLHCGVPACTMQPRPRQGRTPGACTS